MGREILLAELIFYSFLVNWQPWKSPSFILISLTSDFVVKSSRNAVIIALPDKRLRHFPIYLGGGVVQDVLS